MVTSTEANLYINIKQRQDIVLGVVLAMIAGFLINTISSIFYDVVVSKTLLFQDISKNLLAVLFIALVIFESFLEFLIYDVRQGQDVYINKKFWSRYLDFFDNKHWAHRTALSVASITWLVVKWLLWFSFVVAFIQSGDWYSVVTFVCFTIVYQCFKRGAFRKKK